MTKKEKVLLDNYRRASATTLQEVYTTCSTAKHQAFLDCRADLIAHNGHGGRIPSANAQFFTYAFIYQDEDGRERLRYHTHANVYDFEIA